MPQLRFPKRDVEGIPSSLKDNDKSTSSTIIPSGVVSVTYTTPKTVYAIILLAKRAYHYSGASGVDTSIPLPDYLSLYATTDGSNFFLVQPFRLVSSRSLAAESKVVWWWINRSIKGWRIHNSSNLYHIDISEIITLVPDDTKPFLHVIYPDSIEVVNIGTTNLDSFSGLPNISDGDDNTYATFTFRGGYSAYTLYLRGSFSIPMASVISPFALIEIDPLSSNIAGIINQNRRISHGYFHWGANDSISYTSNYISSTAAINQISNSPRLRWSQKAYENRRVVSGGAEIQGVLTDDILRPDNVDTDRMALTAPLNPSLIITNKTLYAPYFFSLMHWPVFVAGLLPDYIYFATDDLAEPLVYTAANGATGKITLNFGLRIATSSNVSQPFAVKLYGMGFLCFPQMDLDVPLTHSPDAVWFDHVPQGNVTRDNNELTESTDVTTDERFVTIYPTAVDVSSADGRTIRFRIRSTSSGDSTFTVKRYYGFHRASDDTILWYSQDATYNVGATLQSFDVLGEDQYGQTKVIKVEIIPI
jgi:hypothetical protein